jgi:riboflavin-specific deaminase-like protein
VLVGVGTAIQDDPQLTVRMVPGASPMRVVLDSTLRLPDESKLLTDDAAPTIILTTNRSDDTRREQVGTGHVGIRVLPTSPDGVDIVAALRELRDTGVQTLLVEGGARVITTLLKAGLVDRLIVSVAPTIIGQGTEAVGPLGVTSIAEGIPLTNRSIHVLDDDVLLSWDLAPPAS